LYKPKWRENIIYGIFDGGVDRSWMKSSQPLPVSNVLFSWKRLFCFSVHVLLHINH